MRTSRLSIAISSLIVLAALTWGTSAAQAARCAHADTLATAASPAAMRAAVLCLVNKERHAHGLPGLHESWRLDRSAQGWSNTMVRTGVFSHGSDFAGRITAAGFNWSWAGENIASGFPTPRSVVLAWMASTGHCHNILDPNYSYVGTGVNIHWLGPYGPATWTQDFALPWGQSPPSQNFGPSDGCPY